MNTYHCFYKNKKVEIEAATSLLAQLAAAARFKAKKSFDVTVVLVAKDGVPVTHLPLM
jgi:hypothetical protein